jgi:hypothetical protein
MQRESLLALLLVGCSSGSPALDAEVTVQLPGGEPGIGLDDLRFSETLGRLVSPAGRTGRVDLVDPETLDVTSIDGFSAFASFDGGDQQGVESADEGGGLVFAVDRASFMLDVVDPAQGAIVAATSLEQTEPDYVRFSSGRSEVWISNVNHGRVEVLTAAGASAPVHAAFIPVPDGPEGLAIDDGRDRAYVRGFAGDVIVIDTVARTVVDRWSTGCPTAHGIPIVDPNRPFVYVGCSDATVVVLDATAGANLGRFHLGPGPSIIAYAPLLHHLYLRGDGVPDVVELAVSPAGDLTELDRFTATDRGHCMAADGAGHLWVCDWSSGRLLRFSDVQPQS